jgi:hypothetical protein
MHEQRCEKRVEGVHAFELFERDVFALRELDDVFDAVNDLQAAARVYLGDAKGQYLSTCMRGHSPANFVRRGD